MLHRFTHALLTLAAIIFLIEAWLWDMTLALGHFLVGLIPWQTFKDAIVRLVAGLPPYGALPLFLIPFVIIEPLKIVAIEQLAHGHFIRGVAAFIALKFVGVGLIAFIFDLTRDKLLSIGWFARFYAWVVMWRDRAHEFIAPYKAQVRLKLAELKAQLPELRRRLGLPEGRGGLMETLARIRERARKAER